MTSPPQGNSGWSVCLIWRLRRRAGKEAPDLQRHG